MSKYQSKKKIKLIDYADNAIRDHKRHLLHCSVIRQIDRITEKIELIEQLKKYT